ncbi:N-terminal Xaa-Pro-Lys N-methyltransferase 1 isoform X2 [Melanotaenia boesemani]|uniref:N-terminal Xaa-Pro-Lys N-methyltransferase 1 isoform X2 n=1 Tax=Melanotaenia boesemani TaxID=1250792 RepID=UPI001C054CBE|nr:N-terminal Xaa-Pro-Lys N-methyltransferase 1 isoform X2 [Melanotaenia boesemani]
MSSALQLPVEVWLQVFSFLSWGDKLSMRSTCTHFKRLLDESASLWRGFSVVLQDLSRYNRRFWRSLAQRHVRIVSLRAGKDKDLKLLSTWLPLLDALQLDIWTKGSVQELKVFRQLRCLCVTSCATEMMSLDFIFPLSRQLTQLSLCNVHFTCPASHLLASLTQLTSLTSLLLHHDGSLRITSLSVLLTHLTKLTHLSWTMVTYRTLSPDFFSPAHLTDPSPSLPLTDLQLLNYDAMVTQEVLQPLRLLRSLSIFHLYSVPGPTCHLQTWLTSLPQLCSLSVHDIIVCWTRTSCICRTFSFSARWKFWIPSTDPTQMTQIGLFISRVHICCS